MMEKKTVNAVGEACPIPVVKATRALREMQPGGELEVMVDNEVAVQNLRRMAEGHHFSVSVEQRDGTIRAVTIRVTAPVDPVGLGPDQAETAQCCPAPGSGLVVAVDTDTMGRGNETLGKTLIKGFFFALGQMPALPSALLFYNGGAHLTCEGSEVLEDLRAMEQRGVTIRTCGTCLDFYGLKEQLAVGTVTNMYEIVETLASAGKVIKP